jgi:hypothetical protein
MKSLVLSAALTLLLAAPSLADDARIERTLRGSWETGHQAIHIDLPPAEVAIETAPDGRLSADIDVTCNDWSRHCRERAEHVALEAGAEGGGFRIGVRGMPRASLRGLSLHGRIRVPRGASVELDMGVGEVHVRDVEGHLDVDVGVGEVHVRSPERAVQSVHLGVGIGEASLDVAGRDVRGHGWLGRNVDWGGGEGHSRVNVRVGVGEAHISVD